MSLPTTLNAPVQWAAQAIADLNAARHRIMAAVGAGRSPADKQAILLSNMLERGSDAMSDDFTRITMGEMPRYEVVLRDKATGFLYDVHYRRPL